MIRVSSLRFLGILLLLLVARLPAQDDLLQSGPMVGYAEMRDVMLWVQTKKPANVQFSYHAILDKETSPGLTAEIPLQFSQAVQTEYAHACTAHVLLENLLPGKKYEYELYINGDPVSRPYPLKFATQAWRNNKDEIENGNSLPVRIALGSCAFFEEPELFGTKEPYGGQYQIFDSIAAKNPDLMLWLGDNLYFTEADWSSRAGMLRRYTFCRSYPKLQPLLAICSHYAIWDDHDFGPNDSDRSFWNKNYALEAFELFWANPNYGVMDQPGITTSFQWNDVQFFLLDDRYHRTPNKRKSGAKTQLGEFQVEWLIDALAGSNAPFKLVVTGGQVLSPLEHHETYANVQPEEREKILRLIQQEKISGVIFVNGDRHFSEVNKLERQGTYPLYEFTVSPLTSGAFATAKESEAHLLQIPESVITVRNFALLDVSGARNARNLKITYYDSDGGVLYSRQINQAELK